MEPRASAGARSSSWEQHCGGTASSPHPWGPKKHRAIPSALFGRSRVQPRHNFQERTTMSNHKASYEITDGRNHTTHDHDASGSAGVSRRDFFKGAAAGMVVGGAAGQLLAREAAAKDLAVDNGLLDRLLFGNQGGH